MTDTRYLFQLAGGMPVVTPPVQIDTTSQVPAAAGQRLRPGPREHVADPAADVNSLASSITAMSEATARLPAVRVWDRPPALASFPPRGQAWELARYRADQAHLAGHTIGETFGRAVTFLTLAGANTPPAGTADIRR
jgi:hypothetical protein